MSQMVFRSVLVSCGLQQHGGLCNEALYRLSDGTDGTVIAFKEMGLEFTKLG